MTDSYKETNCEFDRVAHRFHLREFFQYIICLFSFFNGLMLCRSFIFYRNAEDKQLRGNGRHSSTEISIINSSVLLAAPKLAADEVFSWR